MNALRSYTHWYLYREIVSFVAEIRQYMRSTSLFGDSQHIYWRSNGNEIIFQKQTNYFTAHPCSARCASAQQYMAR